MAASPPASSLDLPASRTFRLALAGRAVNITATSITAIQIVATPENRWFKRGVLWVAYDNKDSITHKFILSLYDGSTDHDFWKETMPAGETGFWRWQLTLDQSLTQSLRGRLLEATVTTESEFIAQYEDRY